MCVHILYYIILYYIILYYNVLNCIVLYCIMLYIYIIYIYIYTRICIDFSVETPGPQDAGPFQEH